MTIEMSRRAFVAAAFAATSQPLVRALALDGASDVIGFRTALEDALPVIRNAAATWGIDAIDATPLVSMSGDGMRQLEQRALLDREKRVLDWLAERGQSPGPDGRPTTAQYTTYDTWIEQAMNEHREEIEAAREEFRQDGQIET
jgi:hypothetical protein